MVVTANPTNAAGYKVGIAGVFALHKDAVTPENRGGAMTFGNLPVLKIDFGINAQTSHNPGNWIPGHFDQIFSSGGRSV
jgi:hypothetical protein